MATFTGFCFGTGEKSTMKKKNIISQFSEAIPPEDRFVREGPGMLGKEVTPNAKESVNDVVKWLLKQEDDKNTLNLSGFSRGSVTCIEIANRLKKLELALEAEAKKDNLSPKGAEVLRKLKNLEINIFAMDPVAGMSDKGVMDRRVIPDNVKSYVAVLQTDEMRRDFKPQDMTRAIIASPNTQVSMLPMYGNHSDTTKIKKDSMQSGAKIMWHSLYQFLTQHGTTFKDGKMPQMVTSDPKKAGNPYSDISQFPPETQSKEMLKLFNQHHQEREAYLKSGKTVKLVDGIPVPRDVRSLNNHLDFYVKNSDFFVNQLERELFKVSYPKVFNYLFEQNQKDPHFPDDSASNPEDVIKELKQLKDEDPALFARLSARGVGLDGQEPTVGEPGGVYCTEPCSTVRQMFPGMLPEGAKSLDPDVAKLAALEKDVHRLTFKYEREKSELLAFSQRSQAGKAQALRDEVRNIIENEPGSPQDKYDKVLNKVEEHYKHLTEASSASQLPHMLRGLLAQHDRHFQVKDTSVPRVVMAEFIHAGLSLLKETVDLTFSLGHLGGGILSAVGTALQDFGRRCNDVIGKVGWNPLKGLASAVAYAFEGIGFAIKNSFGLKPLGNVITSAISDIRDEAVKAIGPVKVEKVDSTEKCKQLKKGLHDLQEKPKDPDMGNKVDSSIAYKG
ncbi:DUF5621 domain-containing protein [Legionella feeleii]|uniref:Dot/Icm T4SS effector n=1 Tax=Legionella feeleii TaxID=453 RepID=A0A378IQI8_9GAMM|nr:DUF5621 domain-containing protein [Legionella feeleii]STX37498.1 Dot/Icm T4SS effector [Legionella feeleii]